ncbi:MAG TPA: hypothetical protein VFT84_14465, partial [Gemmatimonadales bacterium]|nr:hypothetical protein [Gemmatimonadales bacterium]
MTLPLRSAAIRAACLLTLLGILADPLEGQESGVLLGYAHAGEYRTMWLTMSASAAEAVADVPDLIVPRATGFWRLGITTLCDAEGTRQAVWRTPLDRPPAVPGIPCPEVEPLDQTDPDALDRAAAESGEDAGCDSYTAAIHAVSPGWISEGFTFSQTEECEPRGGRWRDSSAVRRFDRPAA